MYIIANYEVSMKGSKSEIMMVTSLLAEKLNDNSMIGKKKIHVEDDHFFCGLEDVQALAVELAKVAGAATFKMKGFIDASASAGEYMDFEITFDGKKFISKSSVWYTELSGEDFDNYEEFCEEYCDDDDEPLYTEEQYEAMCEEPWFVLETEDGDVAVEKVPLTEVEELTIG